MTEETTATQANGSRADGSQTNGTDPSDRSTDPSRFAELLPARASDDRRTGEVVGSAVALLLLLIGLPVALVLLAGPPPIPTSVPSARDFAQQLSIEDLLTVLVGVLWLTWLWFCVCVVAEVIAARRGGLARSVPLSGPLQRLARTLVGAMLLTGIMAGQAQAMPETSVAAPSTVSMASMAVTPAVQAAEAIAEQSTVEESDLVGNKVYTVAAPKDGYHDNLWDIADRHLGDGRRYHEIYELNKDRAQPDGARLELARLIQPGWELIMPDDAVGIERVAAPVSEQAPPAVPVGGPAASSMTDAADGAGSTGAVEQADESRSGWIAGIGLLAAGVLGALALQRRRSTGRRPDDDALDLEAALRFAASTERANRLDHVLRDLTGRCRAAGVNPPPAYSAVVDDDSVELMIAPPRPEAVDGWEALDDGRRWRTTVQPEGARPADAVPYPALVALGVDPQGRDVLVDLESAGGIVAVTGDPNMAGQVAAAIAVQAATAPWADVVRVSAADLPEGIEQIGDSRMRIVDLADELDGFERQIDSLRDGVLTGRLGRRGTATTHLVVSGQVPAPEVSTRLGALMGAGRQAFSVLVAGEHPGARWRLQVDENGTLTLPLLDVTVEANRISAAQVSAAIGLFEASREEEPAASGDRVAIDAPLRDHDDADWTAASRRVAVLGRVAVQGGGPLADERADLVTELVTYLALHPEGVHPTVLAGAIWPRGVTADVRDASIARAREWLGTESDGSHVLREDADGRLSLSRDVVCDWDCARQLLLRSRRATSPREEIDLLRRGLNLMRGPAFTDVPQGRYGWTAREDLPRTVVLVAADAAARLAQLLTDQGDPAGAASAATAGLQVNAADQNLWRALLRSRHASDGVAGVQKTIDEMGVALQSVPLEAETEALLTELMPGTGAGSVQAG